MADRTLTGKVRFREQKRWFRPSLLVLQVEERVRGTQTDGDRDGEGIASAFEYTQFRDVVLSDLKSPVQLAEFPSLL